MNRPDLSAGVDAANSISAAIRKGASGHDICFIHPKGDGANPVGGEGVLIELVQAPRDVIAAYEQSAR